MPVHKWIWPLVLVAVLVFVLSLRQLSDPDLGFHLKYGKWIVTNHHVPVTDISTYTVTQHPYTDLHWLFQVVLYAVFRLTGYPGISLYVCLLSLLLFLLMLWRQQTFGIPLSITCIALLSAFLLIDPRIAPRPEMITFLFLTGTIFILDLHYDRRKNLLFILPVIMLVWCNMHALFVLGMVVMAVYFLSDLVNSRKPDKSMLTWIIISFLACLINPYGLKGFSLPIELLTRFDPQNIYNQHIQEFIPFFAQSHFVVRDYLFLSLSGITVLFILITFHNSKIHEIIILFLFAFIAFRSIRNIPLFVLVAIPVVSHKAYEISGKIRFRRKKAGLILYIMMIVIPLALIPRMLTNAWYISNNSFNKTGMGINASHQPLQASDFLLNNHLDGRILNSIGFGGWLSWTLPQPIFIDGRLEVMQEPIYEEVTESWRGGLPRMINKYHPQLIIYNYVKYYPWTFQLKELNDWRLIYADGLTAIFASNSYANEIPRFDLSGFSSSEKMSNHGTLINWLQGFYQKISQPSIDIFHMDMLRLQINSESKDYRQSEKALFSFNVANLKYSKGDFNGALAAYDTAIMHQPSYAKAYNNRGILKASALKDYLGAIADFTRAIELNPRYGDAYLGRGTVCFLMHNLQGACKDWGIAHSLGNIQAARLIELHCNR